MRIQFGIGSSSNNNNSSSSSSNCHLQHGFFMITNDLIERYDQNNDLITYTLTDDDQDMIDRSRQALKSSFSSLSSSSSILSSTTAMNAITGTSISSLKRDLKIMSTKFNQSLSGLPMILRDLLSKLPTHISVCGNTFSSIFHQFFINLENTSVGRKHIKLFHQCFINLIST